MTQSKISFKGAAAIPSITTTNTEEQEQEINIDNDPKRQRTNHDIEDGELRDDLLLPSAGSDILTY